MGRPNAERRQLVVCSANSSTSRDMRPPPSKPGGHRRSKPRNISAAQACFTQRSAPTRVDQPRPGAGGKLVSFLRLRRTLQINLISSPRSTAARSCLDNTRHHCFDAVISTDDRSASTRSLKVVSTPPPSASRSNTDGTAANSSSVGVDPRGFTTTVRPSAAP